MKEKVKNETHNRSWFSDMSITYNFLSNNWIQLSLFGFLFAKMLILAFILKMLNYYTKGIIGELKLKKYF
jgi:hypothetical protein